MRVSRYQKFAVPGSGRRRTSIMAGTNPDGTTPGRDTRVPAYARVGRFLFALLASSFVGCVVTQVFFAGMGAFGADWDWHTTFVPVLQLLALAMIPVTFIGRLPWTSRLLPFGLLVLIGAQYAFASVPVPAAAFHPVNALLILLVSLQAARRAWATVAEHKKG